MNQVSFEEIGAVVATFYAAEGVSAGDVVKLTDNATVGSCAAGDKFCGVAISNREGCAGVQVKGFMTLPITGAVALGLAELAGNGSGGVKTASGGVKALVVSVDTAAGTAVVCL